MKDLEILNPGLFTTIQDKGRTGYQEFGMPVAGAMDEFSLRVGNMLLENDEYEAAMEATVIGPEILFNKNTVISITGADMDPKINNQSIPLWHAIKISKGDKLSFGTLKSGCRCYICFAGGIDVPEVMGSKSTYVKAGIGGFKGRILKVGDKINLTKYDEKIDELVNRTIPKSYMPSFKKKYVVRIVMGPQQDYFSEESINLLLKSEYEISNEADRMGYRLSGPKLKHKSEADIISDGIPLGAVQVPGHGMPIIMMADRQTTGGYTKIGTVISTDIPILGQVKPGDKVRLKNISINEAHKILRKYEEKLKNINKSIYVNNISILKKEKCFLDVGNDYYDFYSGKIFK